MTKVTCSGRNCNAGFTIIELLIATLVFSSVLVLITVGVLTFTKNYFKGVNQSNTQTVARTIIEGIAQSIQFSGDEVQSPPVLANPADPTTMQGFCVGNQLYSYRLGWQLADGAPNAGQNQSLHGLVVEKGSSCGGATARNVSALPATLPANSTELLTPMMRLAKLDVVRPDPADPTVWRITVRVVFGDNDLLCSPSTPGDCASTAATTLATNSDAICKSAIQGSQYCAVSELSTVVKRRLSAAP